MLKKMEIKKYIFYICYVERGLNFIVVVNYIKKILWLVESFVWKLVVIYNCII